MVLNRSAATDWNNRLPPVIKGMKMFGWTKKGPDIPKRAAETSAACDGGAVGTLSGLISGTKVASQYGWRDVAGIAVGDTVLTFDAGLQTVTKVARTVLWSADMPCPKAYWPLEVPAGALGNRTTMHLQPQQPVMLECDSAEKIYGDPFAMIQARALEGISGICRVPPKESFEVITLYFEREQVVFSNSGALFFCPSSRSMVDAMMDDGTGPDYAPLPHEEAVLLAGAYEAEMMDGFVPQPRFSEFTHSAYAA